jgi:hypothetical protein
VFLVRNFKLSFFVSFGELLSGACTLPSQKLSNLVETKSEGNCRHKVFLGGFSSVADVWFLCWFTDSTIYCLVYWNEKSKKGNWMLCVVLVHGKIEQIPKSSDIAT